MFKQIIFLQYSLLGDYYVGNQPFSGHSSMTRPSKINRASIEMSRILFAFKCEKTYKGKFYFIKNSLESAVKDCVESVSGDLV